ncbi:MAG: mismatch repair protein MutL protein [candidate division WS6 bacterium GW2011_GWE1_34_7]|uniref:DNA mismatch repair protein MutL n=1 Tax=candidate division WS6 bacterium GW2011_GWE1_34_7 TaxID=1619093 RepID=A0A0G0BIU5_9BACT|nr:MAG: mismatch repair protein MutL protein [candidate division WS6 bacterium GW2011_GWE1_34_7]
MSKPVLNKLSQEVVNQIAAGEVVERPASVVKELLDNAIDAKADRIEIKVKEGGLELIEISDNGIGIPKRNLSEIFLPHTTSKINRIEDLNTLLSMGFRGEALSTITSVSRVHVISKYEDEGIGNLVMFNEKGQSDVRSAAKEQGTTVRVENLFYNIPARRKYLKSAPTEYRKIYELLNRYFVVYPNISFKLEKDGKEVLSLDSIVGHKAGEICKERVIGIYGDDELVEIKYDGNGIKINGYSGHPSSHKSKNTRQLVFVNGRPVMDRGIMRAVYEGYSRYLPFGEKVNFYINIDINPELVDVNVHPRKEEVRFENPFRVYSAIEEAVKHALNKELSFQIDSTPSPIAQRRESFNSSSESKEYSTREIKFDKQYSSVKDSMLFSKEALTVSEEGDAIRNIFQIFDKYIVIEFVDERLWVIDQHAAAERINFEKIQKREEKPLDIQNLLVPTSLIFSKEERLFLEEFISFFQDIGIEYDVKEYGIDILSLPSVLSTANTEALFKEIFEISDNLDTLKKEFNKKKEDILATVACHTSIRSGQKLNYEEMRNLFEELSSCENPYSCPHGRPAIWKLTREKIDTNFERTY